MKEFTQMSPVEMARLMYEDGETLEFEGGAKACWNNGRFVMITLTLSVIPLDNSWSSPCRVRRREFPFKQYDRVMMRSYGESWLPAIFMYVANDTPDYPFFASFGMAFAFVAEFEKDKIGTHYPVNGQWGPEDVR